MRQDVCTVLPSQETPSSSSSSSSTPPTLNLPPAEPVAWTPDLFHSPTVAIFAFSVHLKTGGGWRREPPPLPMLVQQASFSSQWPPAQVYQPGQQSGVNAPNTPIVSELMKCSLPVPSHSLATRQMTSGNVLNGYRHTLGHKVTKSHLVLAPWLRPCNDDADCCRCTFDDHSGINLDPSSTTLHRGGGFL